MIAVFQEVTHEEDYGGEFNYEQFVAVFNNMAEVGIFLKEVGKEKSHFSYLEITPGIPVEGSGYCHVSVYDIDWMNGKLGNILRSGYEKRDLKGHTWMFQGNEILPLREGVEVNGVELHQPGYDPALAQEHVDLMMMTLKVNRLWISLGKVVKFQ